MKGRSFTTIIADDLYAGHTHKGGDFDAMFQKVFQQEVLLAFREANKFKPRLIYNGDLIDAAFIKPTKGEKMKNRKLTALEKRQDKAICELYSRLSSAKVVTESIQLRRQAEAEDNAITALVTTAKSFGCRVIVSIGYRGELVYTAEKSVRA